MSNQGWHLGQIDFVHNSHKQLGGLDARVKTSQPTDVNNSVELQQSSVEINGCRLAYFHTQRAIPAEQTILMVHGMGCHARVWDATLRALTSSCAVICVELRGHGRSEKRGPYRWDSLGRDLCTFIRTLELRSITAVGHSLGAHLLLQAAAILSTRFDALLLLEPVVLDPRAYSAPQLFDAPEEHPYASRKAVWNSPEEWYQAIRDREPFKLWNTEVLWDYCRYGLEETANGMYQLCCPPLVEAEIALSRAAAGIHSLLDSVEVPATVVRAEVASGGRHPMDNIHSTTWTKLADHLPQGTDKYHPELTHFVPMQSPEFVARELNELVVH